MALVFAFVFAAILCVADLFFASVFLGAAFLRSFVPTAFFGGFIAAVFFRLVCFLPVFLVAMGEVYHCRMNAH
ncbi:MAG: hypothetical protein ABSD76_08905 [Terriglobales bacterium]